MKKCFSFVSIIFLMALPVVATPALRAYLTTATFNNPAKGPYIETYISVIGNSVKFVKNSKGKFQGDIDIAIKFSLGNEIKNAQKYTLSSPETDDTTKGYPNFIAQQRYSLPNGKYTLEISIADKNNPKVAPFVNSMPVEIEFVDNKVCVSEVQLLETFTKSTTPTVLTKSGYDLVPYVSNFFPENSKSIRFYAEIYNTKRLLGEGQKMLISYSIEANQSNTKLNNFSSFSKQTTNDVNILLSELNIESLPSGNYNIIIEVRDKENNLLATRKSFFQRKNKPIPLSFDDLKSIDVSTTFVKDFKSVDTLREYIRTLRPISSATEIQFEENQMKRKDLVQMQQFFYNFWKSRNDIQPEAAWQEYNQDVMKVNKEYGTHGLKGYDSDRGRVYLQYGSPTIMARYDHEPNVWPYEIWQYNALVDKTQLLTTPYNQQSNKKFVFGNTDLSTNRYELIHSTAKGEVFNSIWPERLVSREFSTQNMDSGDETSHDAIYDNIMDSFKNPR